MFNRQLQSLLIHSISAAPITISLVLISTYSNGIEWYEKFHGFAEIVYYVFSVIGILTSIYGLKYSRYSYKIIHIIILVWQGYAHLVYIRIAPIPWIYVRHLLL